MRKYRNLQVHIFLFSKNFKNRGHKESANKNVCQGLKMPMSARQFRVQTKNLSLQCKFKKKIQWAREHYREFSIPMNVLQKNPLVWENDSSILIRLEIVKKFQVVNDTAERRVNETHGRHIFEKRGKEAIYPANCFRMVRIKKKVWNQLW